MQDPKWRDGLSLLEKHDLSWDLHVVWHIEEAAEVVSEHPRLKTVLNHTGYPLDRSPEALVVWRRGMEALAASPNVCCKISVLTVGDEPWTLVANRPIILDAIRIFGVDRCMFASNFPVDGLKGAAKRDSQWQKGVRETCGDELCTSMLSGAFWCKRQLTY